MSYLEQVISHRGASAYAPENTMAAFECALTLGSHCVEFDVMLSADGDPFVFHDDTLNRTTNGKGLFANQSSEQIRKLDAGKWFSKRFKDEKIPTFEEMIKWLIANNIHANIEIKPTPGKTEETTIAVLSALNRLWPVQKPWPLVSSFEWEALTLARSLSPELPLGLLLDKWDKNWENMAHQLSCISVHMSVRAATKLHIQQVKSKGYKVYVYTVNRIGLAEKLLSWGVDGIFSDYPDILSQPK